MSQLLPLWEIILGATLLVASLLIHGVGMNRVQTRHAKFQRLHAAGHLRRQAMFCSLILLILLTHLLEILGWSFMLMITGAVSGLRDAYYYAAVTYTTLGYREGTLSLDWRIFAPMIAMSGLFAFGWTTGVLMIIVARSDRPAGG